MNKTDRLQDIQEILTKNGRVEVSNLCRIFNVSEMTIRRDLNILVKNGVAIRSHGGALLFSPSILNERAYELRSNAHIPEKKAIARAALNYITSGIHCFFDSSSTVYNLARIMPNDEKLIVVTDTLKTAIELNNRTNVEVIMIGGEIRKSTYSATGIFAEKMLESMNFDVAFLGISSITMEGDITTTTTTDFQTKSTVLRNSKTKILMFDSSKISSKPDFLLICNIVKFDIIITDSGIPDEFVKNADNKGIKTIIVNPA